jgi:hypothetical protein
MSMRATSAERGGAEGLSASGVRSLDAVHGADRWPLLEGAVIALLRAGRDGADARACVDRLHAAVARAGGFARVHAAGSSDEGDAVAAALFETGVRGVEFSAGATRAEIASVVEVVAACVRHAARAPFDPRRPRLSSEHVELRTAPIGEVGDVATRELRLEATRALEAAAFDVLARAARLRNGRPSRTSTEPIDGRFSNDGWDERFARLSVDAAIAEVRSGGDVALPEYVATRPLLRAQALAELAARALDGELEAAVRTYLEAALSVDGEGRP